MLFIAVLFFFLVYLAILVAVAVLAAKWAERHNRSTWRWGGGVALGMYLLVFWDFIPSLLAHKYYCGKEAGFWVYASPTQWQRENPGVGGAMKWYVENGYFVGKREKLPDGSEKFWLSDRFYNVIRRGDVFANEISKVEEVVVDAETQKPLARAVDFVRGDSLAALSLGNWKSVSSLMLGLGNRNCGEPMAPSTEQLRDFRNQLVKIKGVSMSYPGFLGRKKWGRSPIMQSMNQA
jgi:hypothetical protein